MQSDASTDKQGDRVILYVKYIKYTRVRDVFWSVIHPENATENEFLKVTALEIKNTDFLPGYVTLFTSKLDLNLRKKLIKCYIWSMALYGTETWTLWAADQKYLECFKMWCWRRMEKISWTDHVRNEKSVT